MSVIFHQGRKASWVSASRLEPQDSSENLRRWVSFTTVISLNTKVIQQDWIELFGTELGFLDTYQQRGRQTQSKHQGQTKQNLNSTLK